MQCCVEASAKSKHGDRREGDGRGVSRDFDGDGDGQQLTADVVPLGRQGSGEITAEGGAVGPRFLLGNMGPDPITGQPIRSEELVKATPAEVADFLRKYNELEGDKTETGGQEDVVRPVENGTLDPESEARSNAKRSAPTAFTETGIDRNGTPRAG